MTGMGVVMKNSSTRHLLAAIGATIGVVLMVQPASALPSRIGLAVQDALPHAGHLVDGRFAAAPAAFSEFCANYASQCLSTGGASVVDLDVAKWEELLSVNASVNGRIAPVPDAKGEDHWTLDVNQGDCDEYAVQKRKALLDLGWPSAALSLSAAYIPGNVGHLVLVVRTDRGDFVLDNLRQTVVPADRVAYRWVARQSTLHPMLWVKVNGTRHDDLQQMVRAPRNEQVATVTPAVAATSDEVTGAIVKVADTTGGKTGAAAAALDNYLLNR